MPLAARLAERVTSADPTVRAIQARKAQLEESRRTPARFIRPPPPVRRFGKREETREYLSGFVIRDAANESVRRTLRSRERHERYRHVFYLAG